MKMVGPGREAADWQVWSPQKYCGLLLIYFRDEGIWMSDYVRPFASVLLGIPLTSASLVTEAAIHIQFFLCVRIVHV